MLFVHRKRSSPVKKLEILRLLSILLVSSALGMQLHAQMETLPPGVATSTEEAMILVHEGDALYDLRTETKGGLESFSAYEKAFLRNPSLVEAYWKASRSSYWIADSTPALRNKVIWFEKGIEFAQKAIELEPKSPDAHFWLGAHYGSLGEAKGVLKSLALVKPIRKEMETLVRLDDKYQGGAGYRVLGIVDYKVPGFAGGSKKRALENLQKAVAIDPGNAYNQYYLAEFFEITGDRYKALNHLQTLDSLTPTSDVDAPDLEKLKRKAQKLKKKLKV